MKRGICVSDLHCGSFYGLLPPEYITFEGVPKLPNAGQVYTWECWLHFVQLVEDYQPDFVICNGDLIDGPQRKQDGAELSLSAWQDQRDACKKVLKVLRSATRKAKWYFTQGTPYHVGNFGAAEEDIAEAMDATSYPSVGTGKLCREVLTLEVDGGVIIEAAHHINFSSVYRATPLEREAQATWMDSVKNDSPVPDLQIRSHVHSYTNIEQERQRIVTSPAWQLPTRFSRKHSVHRLRSQLGGIFIEADYKAKKSGATACHVFRKLYKLPKVEIATL